MPPLLEDIFKKKILKKFVIGIPIVRNYCLEQTEYHEQYILL